jgi:pilus assembly protein Flp/PilA
MLVQKLSQFARDEDGATAIEYGLLAALISVAVISAFTVLGNGLIAIFGSEETGAGKAISDATATL